MKNRKTITLLAAATAGCLALLATFVYTSALQITKLEALPDQTTRRVFLRTGDSGWSNGAYMYSWGGETKTTAMIIKNVLDAYQGRFVHSARLLFREIEPEGRVRILVPSLLVMDFVFVEIEGELLFAKAAACDIVLHPEDFLGENLLEILAANKEE